jgi:hypothetical protein
LPFSGVFAAATGRARHRLRLEEGIFWGVDRSGNDLDYPGAYRFNGLKWVVDPWINE